MQTEKLLEELNTKLDNSVQILNKKGYQVLHSNVSMEQSGNHRETKFNIEFDCDREQPLFLHLPFRGWISGSNKNILILGREYSGKKKGWDTAHLRYMEKFGEWVSKLLPIYKAVNDCIKICNSCHREYHGKYIPEFAECPCCGCTVCSF